MVGPAWKAPRWGTSRGFPTDLPMVGQIGDSRSFLGRRGFPTDLPMVGPLLHAARVPFGRGFPTDLPMVGLGYGRRR